MAFFCLFSSTLVLARGAAGTSRWMLLPPGGRYLYQLWRPSVDASPPHLATLRTREKKITMSIASSTFVETHGGFSGGHGGFMCRATSFYYLAPTQCRKLISGRPPSPQPVVNTGSTEDCAGTCSNLCGLSRTPTRFRIGNVWLVRYCGCVAFFNVAVSMDHHVDMSR